jgi:hypothetical protein
MEILLELPDLTLMDDCKWYDEDGKVLRHATKRELEMAQMLAYDEECQQENNDWEEQELVHP